MSPRIEGLTGKVIAHKFLIPRKELDITKVLGTSGQIILNDLNRKVKQIYPSSKLVFNSSKELTPEEELGKKIQKTDLHSRYIHSGINARRRICKLKSTPDQRSPPRRTDSGGQTSFFQK